MDINFEIVDFDVQNAQIAVKFTADVKPEGITLMFPLPVENGELVTDPEKLADILRLAVPRHAFVIEQARADFNAKSLERRASALSALVGMKRTVTVPMAGEMSGGQPADASAMRVGKIKEI